MAVCFIEVDSFGNIVHIQRNPGMTITPVVNVVTFSDPDGKELKDANGENMGPHGHRMYRPVRISEQEFRSMMEKEAVCLKCNGAKGNCPNCRGSGKVKNDLKNYRFRHLDRKIERLN